MLKYNIIMMKYYYYKAFILLILGVIFSDLSISAEPKSKNEKAMVVVIDPGHGGKDPGAVNKGIREKDVVLGIGLKLGKLLNDNYPDVKVVFTRSTDVFVPLIERSRIANKSKADLFISIHANYCGTPAIRGTETFVLGLHRSAENLEVAKKENSVILLEEDYTQNYEGFDPNSSESYIMFELVQDIYMDQSLAFADAIQNQFRTHLSNTLNRGVKQAGFLVLRQSSMPSVLIESGFISNLAEANLLNSSEGQQNIAGSVLEAFRKFKSKNSVSPPPANVEKQLVVADETIKKNSEKTPIVAESTPSNTPEKPVITSEKIVEEKAEPVDQQKKTATVAPDKTGSNNPDLNAPDQKLKNNEIIANTFYSVQIGASTTAVEPIAANFKGLKDIRREKTDKYYRYYIGKETSMEKITPIWQKIKLKFPQAFIVSFVDGKRVIIDSSIIP
jgi:N-acetylmuramoyl-L-alanine amidase